MSQERVSDPPSAFVVEWARRLGPTIPEPRRALDVAMGRGRHALVLAEQGLRTFGVDVKLDAVRDAVARARRAHLTVRGWCADLTRSPLPRARFELVLVTRYLQRDLFDSIVDALTPGGVVIYETFTVDQLATGTGPTSPDHLLERGELAARFAALELTFYEEVDALARLVARKRSQRAFRRS